MGNEYRPLAIYVHVPFCKQKCAYCDFASFAGCEDQIDSYFDALHKEIDVWSDSLRAYRARSIFFGGGTPSLVPAERIAEVLDVLRKRVSFEPDIEISLEANPGTLDMQKLRVYRAAGVNRLSIGVQSFDETLLKQIDRIHTPDDAENAVYMARKAGFENISIDLMYALPGQTMSQWAATLDRAMALPVKHISAYSLIVEEGTRMARRVQEGAMRIPDDDLVNEMQRMAVMRLRKAGFERYEISNFACAGYESRHNITYWTDGEYLGLGSAAHSMMNNLRFENPSELSRYIGGERMLNQCARTRKDRREEMLMLATRMVRGLDLSLWMRELGDQLEETKAEEIRKLQRYGLIEIKDGFLRLTDVGLELQDSVVLELMDD